MIIGAVLMGSAVERVQFMVARIVTGVGIGYVTSVTPVYQSEIICRSTEGLAGLLSVDDDVVWIDVSVLDQLRGLFHQQRVPVAVPAAIPMRVCGLYYCFDGLVTRYAKVVDKA